MILNGCLKLHIKYGLRLYLNCPQPNFKLHKILHPIFIFVIVCCYHYYSYIIIYHKTVWIKRTIARLCKRFWDGNQNHKQSSTTILFYLYYFIQGLKDGQYRIIYTSPEAALFKYRNLIRTLGSLITAVAIDESHCIKKWFECFI